jgi:hypothetical protein
MCTRPSGVDQIGQLCFCALTSTADFRAPASTADFCTPTSTADFCALTSTAGFCTLTSTADFCTLTSTADFCALTFTAGLLSCGGAGVRSYRLVLSIGSNCVDSTKDGHGRRSRKHCV